MDRSNEPKGYTLKLCMLGDGGVGKSTFVERLVTGQFNNRTKMTIGIDFQLITMLLGELKLDIAVWDLGGESQFRFILPTYISGADGALLLFDLSRSSTMDNLVEWADIWRKNTEAGIPLYLIGAKVDRINPNLETIIETTVFQLKQKLNINKHFLTSSKTGVMIGDVITSMAKDIVEFKILKKNSRNCA